jgi:hypothetical protein
MKKILKESKIIQLYLFVLLSFVLGILIIVLFGNLKGNLRNISNAGFFLSLGSYIVLIFMIFPVDYEIKTRYPKATHREKRVLNLLFYSARCVFLWIGLYFWGISLINTNISDKSVVEINGSISSIQVVGTENPSLKIKLDGNTNQYGINTFKMSDGILLAIEKDLLPGKIVYLKIERIDENKDDDTWIQIYGIRTESFTYLTLQDYRIANSKNSSILGYLGIGFTIIGLIILLSGRWQLIKYSKLDSVAKYDN